jgi:hypothetical protein
VTKEAAPERDFARSCPHCLFVIDPPPSRSRLCPSCRQPIVIRLKQLFTRDEIAELKEMARDERAARDAERPPDDSSIEINGHIYTLQGGSAESIRRMIANGTFSGFRKAEPPPEW